MNTSKEKIKILPIIKCILIQLAVTLASVAFFALIMNVLQMDYKFSPVLGSVAVALGCFAGSLCLSSHKGNKGYMWGGIVGGITFAIITLVGMIINNGSITVNTLFHLIITLLSGVIGGISGVNRKPKKYI